METLVDGGPPLLIACASMNSDRLGASVLNWVSLAVDDHPFLAKDNSTENVGVVGAYQWIYKSSTEPIIAYLHDDVELMERGWDRRVAQAFDDPKVGVVGFGGALTHGSPDLYRKPYELTQLARGLYLSNMKDAEIHGKRFTEECEVAVLDGFALVVRRELLDKCGGWDPDNWPPHHIYDYRICAEAHRHRYKVLLVGVACHHRGGETAVSDGYQQWASNTRWGSDVEMHKQGHRKFYDEYRSVMPWRV